MSDEQAKSEYAYSLDEENYTGGFDSREDAIAEGDELAWSDERDQFWTGRAVPYEPVVDGDDVIERMRDRAYEDVDEHSDGWLDNVTPEQCAELTGDLTAAFNAWCERHGHRPHFWTVADVQEHKTTPQDEDDTATAEVPHV